MKSPDEILQEQAEAFQKGIEKLVNEHCLEQFCDMPDYVIAAYLFRCFWALCCASEHKVNWDNLLKPPEPPQ